MLIEWSWLDKPHGVWLGKGKRLVRVETDRVELGELDDGAWLGGAD